MLKRATYEQLPSVEANGPRGTHESHEVMAGILGAGQRARILAGRRLLTAALYAQRQAPRSF